MNYTTLKMRELKEMAMDLNIVPEGDKRYRQTWIDALEAANLKDDKFGLTWSDEWEAWVDCEDEPCVTVIEYGSGYMISSELGETTRDDEYEVVMALEDIFNNLD